MATETKRLASLDALRGFDMLFIIGLAPLIVHLCAMIPGTEWLSEQMTHVEWNGWRHHDTIFPLFLFLAGVSFPFSHAKSMEKGISRNGEYKKILKRWLALIAFGIIYNNFFQFQFSTLRFYSVLGRIGTAWAIAAVLFINFKPKARALIAILILLGYRALCWIPAPDVPNADPLSMEGCLVGYIDRCIMPGHLHKPNFDPEGLLSTLPAIVTAMLGIFTGEYVRQARAAGGKKTLVMIAAAAAMLALGYLWNLEFPINKKLWTSSFVLVCGGYSLACFAIFYWIIDVKGWSKWSFPLQVVGMNSITIYLAARVIDFYPTSKFFFGGFASLCPEHLGKVIIYLGILLLEWLLLYFLYRKKIFLKV